MRSRANDGAGNPSAKAGLSEAAAGPGRGDLSAGRGIPKALVGMAIGTAAFTAGVVATELLFRRHAGTDPQAEDFRNPLRGAPVRATSADGTEIYAEVFGPADAPTFVLVPGWTEQLRYFDPITRILVGRGFRVVSYDLRAQGQSGAPADRDGFGLERYGEDLEAVLTACCDGRSDVVVAGHSMGGMAIVAWAGAFSASSRVRAAALINTGQSALVSESRVVPARVPASVRDAVGAKVILGSTTPYAPLSNPVVRSVSRYMAFGPDATPAEIAFYAPMMWEMNARARGAAGAALAQMDQHWALSKLDIPTLVIAGANDRMTPVSHAERMAAELPSLAGLVVLVRTGHMGPLERPMEIGDELCKLAISVGILDPSLPVPETELAAA